MPSAMQSMGVELIVDEEEVEFRIGRDRAGIAPEQLICDTLREVEVVKIGLGSS